MMPGTTGVSRLARCGSCRGKIKVTTDRDAIACPLCGLTLLNAMGLRALPPIVVSRCGKEGCWRALVSELRLPEDAGATEIRAARLLMVPFWRLVDESKRSVASRGLVVSGADLSPVGLPRLTARRPRIAGLDVERRTRTGDAMGRLVAESGDINAEAVGVMLGPGGGSPGPSLEALAEATADASGPWWQLVYYPLWSFHYIVYNKEYYHVVDATTGQPIGPARRIRRGKVVMAATVPMLATFLALEPLTGPAAAVAAWLVGLASMRLNLRSQRGG